MEIFSIDKQLEEMRTKEKSLWQTAKPSSRASSAVKDPSVILLRNKTNLYDDDIPDDNPDVYYHIRRLREALKLPVDLPRHGPKVRENLEALEKIVSHKTLINRKAICFILVMRVHSRTGKV